MKAPEWNVLFTAKGLSPFKNPLHMRSVCLEKLFSKHRWGVRCNAVLLCILSLQVWDTSHLLNPIVSISYSVFHLTHVFHCSSSYLPDNCLKTPIHELIWPPWGEVVTRQHVSPHGCLSVPFCLAVLLSVYLFEWSSLQKKMLKSSTAEEWKCQHEIQSITDHQV